MEVKLPGGLLEYICKRNYFPKFVQLDFMIDVMTEDKILTAAEYAGRYFTQRT